MPKVTGPEVLAIQTVVLVLEPLNQAQRERVIRWLYDKYLTPVERELRLPGVA